MLTLIKYLIIFDILQLLQLGQKILALMSEVLAFTTKAILLKTLLTRLIFQSAMMASWEVEKMPNRWN